MAERHVLMVVTSCGEMPTGEKTGIWLSEFAEPYEVFRESGFRITVASVRGGKAPIDPRSLTPETEAKWADAIRVLDETVPVDSVGAEGFDALFLPGGHGTMFDLPENGKLRELIRTLFESGRPVGAVCHGPAGLVGVKLSDGTPLVKGRKVTAFTNEEERAVKLDQVMPFLLEDRLRQIGAAFIAAEKWANHVEVDGKLVTGQNPQSGEAAARKLAELVLSAT
ncbi:MAG: glutamine amidotransferase [Thermobacillus sp. ZCTH02-B1]|uniref:type 1 glutamine amidotransferase domain-containing protein n=1 Tax=Thermobacillus sp. ZCTH02-B1 TaxID=1858795 RepID=UPI000B55C88A|nr:type 1 glutamine amidotransferase domain-containing protein [Thermobacillus sp. ZCTH02-B1]OUM97192.1 MAG: glutamine amidotransferase [Thermobacillus sp. ZCTH02-B1]